MSAGLALRVAVDQAWSGVVVGRGGGLRWVDVPVVPVTVEKARSRLATPLAKSPAPVARRSACSGVGLRTPAIARQIGHTQHSALPVDQPPKRVALAHNCRPAACRACAPRESSVCW
ncbi:hypothetical protein AB0C29_35570 [Actinoplanes sp. NPDC048791]|uniref:hypothetical protein n=1 Tax=Actinoplanes sp. NPDC048791 TaxID=3154623 RepID=UPI003402982D